MDWQGRRLTATCARLPLLSFFGCCCSSVRGRGGVDWRDRLVLLHIHAFRRPPPPSPSTHTRAHAHTPTTRPQLPPPTTHAHTTGGRRPWTRAGAPCSVRWCGCRGRTQSSPGSSPAIQHHPWCSSSGACFLPAWRARAHLPLRSCTPPSLPSLPSLPPPPSLAPTLPCTHPPTPPFPHPPHIHPHSPR